MAGSVHKYKTKQDETRYFIMIETKDVYGKRKQRKKMGFITKRDAQKALIEAQNEINKGIYVEPSKMPYAEFMEQWFRTKKKGISIQTVKVYRMHLDTPFLGSILLSKLSTIDIDNFINEMFEKGLSPSTIKKSVNIIKNSLEHGIDIELIRKNVAKKATLPKENKIEMTVWNEEEINRFLKTAKEDRLYAFFFLALMTGMRKGEMLGLRWKDIDFENKKLTIYQILTQDSRIIIKGAKTKASNRSIQLSDSTIKVLKTHKALISEEKLLQGHSYQDQDLVFCTPIGTPIHSSNLRNRVFNPLIEKAKVPKIRIHDLRHHMPHSYY